MPYQSNIPLATDRLSKSQSDLNGNFQELDAYLNVNHTPIDGTGDQGKHKFVTMPSASPDPSALATESTLFSKVGLVSMLPELYWRQGTTNAIKNMTELAQTSPNQGFFWLPCGILCKFAVVGIAGGSNVNNIFQSAVVWDAGGSIPVFSNIPSIIGVTPIRTNPGAANLPAGIVDITTTSNLQVGYMLKFQSSPWVAMQAIIFAMGS